MMRTYVLWSLLVRLRKTHFGIWFILDTLLPFSELCHQGLDLFFRIAYFVCIGLYN